MGIHYDYKSKRGERAMLKEAKRKARLAQKRAKRVLIKDSGKEEAKTIIGAAVVDDILGLLILTVVAGLLTSSGDFALIDLAIIK